MKKHIFNADPTINSLRLQIELFTMSNVEMEALPLAQLSKIPPNVANPLCMAVDKTPPKTCYWAEPYGLFWREYQPWACDQLKFTLDCWNWLYRVMLCIEWCYYFLHRGFRSFLSLIVDVSSVVSCVKHCTRSSSCEASVLDTSSSTCLLYDTAYVNVSEASSGNDLRYIENVCSPTALVSCCNFHFFNWRTDPLKSCLRHAWCIPF